MFRAVQVSRSSKGLAAISDTTWLPEQRGRDGERRGGSFDTDPGWGLPVALPVGRSMPSYSVLPPAPAGIQREPVDGGANHVPRGAITRLGPGHALMRKCAQCDADEGKGPITARRASGAGPVTDDAATHALQAASRGSGAPLPQTARALFEPRFGHDFAGVKIHTDGAASEAARAVQARAYTVGHDIVFAHGQYVPGTREGQRLLAHELTHVVQQGAAGSAGAHVARAADGTPAVSRPEDPFEKEADRIADLVTTGGDAQGAFAPVAQQGGALGVARQPAPSGEDKPASGGGASPGTCSPTGPGTGGTSCSQVAPTFVKGSKLKFCKDSAQPLPGQDSLFATMAAAARTARTIQLHGNASTEGSGTYNQQLSCARVETVAAMLGTAGVSTATARIAHGATDLYGKDDETGQNAYENRNVVLVVDAAPTKPKADEPKADEPKPGTPGGNCCCCPKGLDLNRFTYQGDMFGTHSGHNWDPKVDLDYTPAAAKQSCDMEWWEKTNRPYSEVPAFDTWTRITNPKAGSIEHWDKRKEPCPGKESVYLTDPPSVPHDGKQGNTYTRVLEFRIRVTSGCPSCGEKRGTAVQTLVVEDGKVNEKKSSFLTPNPKDQWADEVKPDDKKP